MRLALLGKPGSGKGTQGARLARHLGVPLVSTGEILRRRAAGCGPDAAALAARRARGERVSDDFVLAVVSDALVGAADGNGYVLDGFPRTLAQAQHPDAPGLDAVINLDVSDEIALRRLAQRAGAGRVDDARQDAASRRLQAFRSETAPVLDLYRRRGILTTVDGTQPPDEVYDAIVTALDRDGGH